MSRVPLSDVRREVIGRREFSGNSIYGQNWTIGDVSMYVVFSYGTHWPLWIYRRGKWYGNSDKYSVTTGRHRTASNPGCIDEWLSCDDMKHLLHTGEPPPPDGIKRLLAVSAEP